MPMPSPLLSSHRYWKVTLFLSCRRKFHMNGISFKRPPVIFPCSKDDPLVQCWLYYTYSWGCIVLCIQSENSCQKSDRCCCKWIFPAVFYRNLKQYYTSFGWKKYPPENSIWNTAVPLLSYSCMFQIEKCSQQLKICKSVCMFIVLAIVVETD